MKNLKTKGALNKMEQIEFKKLLLESALFLMSCDGEIAEVEVNELNEIANKTTYFAGIDLKKELTNLLPQFKTTNKVALQNFYRTLRSKDLSIVQELLLLEINLRLTYSDKKLHESEIEFIKALRGMCNVPDDVLIERFGKLDFLMRDTVINIIREQNIITDFDKNKTELF